MESFNSDMFQVKEQGNLRLISPGHTAAVANAPWSKDTLKYRSRVETLEGDTVSQGFKKFFNLGTGPIDLQIGVEDVAKAVERGDAWATLKLDGSLLIRSVFEGKIMLRTRGSFGYEHLDNAIEMELFRQLYPYVFNPKMFPGWSLLFEWTTPNNVIVLKYDEPTLTLIGAVNHGQLRYATMHELAIMEVGLDVPVVQHFQLDTAGWERLQGELDSRPDIEGYVIRINNCQDLVKVKCAPYLTKHALKSTLSTEKLADMYFQQGQPTFTEFIESFKDAFDEETTMWAMGAISAMFDGVKVLNAILTHMTQKAEERKGLSRKDAAVAGLAEYGQTKRFSAYMLLWEGKPVKTELLKSILLQSSKQVEIGMFSKYESEGE